MVILRIEGEWGAQCTLGDYVKILEAEVDDRIRPITQAEFGFVGAGGF